MPAGLQCWDANGKLIVDIGDFNTRYLGRVNVNFPANTVISQNSFAGVTANGSFATIISVNNTQYQTSFFYSRCYDGGFTLFWLRDPPKVNLSVIVDVHSFI